MQKPANTDCPVHELVRNRWSPRAFSDQPVSPQDLCSLFEAARWAPSSSNEQPWSFIVGTTADPECHAKIVSVLVEFNQLWAKNAPVLVVAVSELEFASNKTPNRNAFYDTGAAVAGLTLEATSRGLFVHQMAGFEPQKAIEVFHIPRGWEPISVFAIGYPGDHNSLPDKLRERELGPRTRKPISQFVMAGDWGHPAPFVSK
jgi:nitroreductase